MDDATQFGNMPFSTTPPLSAISPTLPIAHFLDYDIVQLWTSK